MHTKWYALSDFKLNQYAFTSYRAAKRRCNNPHVENYKFYGGRGIKFLYTNFTEFLADVGPRPQGLTLERINNNKHYEPGNCCWLTMKEQCKNRRKPQVSQ